MVKKKIKNRINNINNHIIKYISYLSLHEKKDHTSEKS